jgi:prephenate dehydrogenase
VSDPDGPRADDQLEALRGERKVAILGCGRFGRALAELAIDNGLQASAWDPAAEVPASIAASSPADLASRAHHIVIAVPTAETRKALLSLAPHVTSRHLVMDVGSVKQGAVQAMHEVLGSRVPWVSTHPLFGSSSIALGERLLAVVCPNAVHPFAAVFAREFYERLGCVVTEQDAAEHDRAMARTHALAFFVAKALMDLGAGADASFTPPSFHAMARTIEQVRTDAGHLFVAIERENPFASDSRQELLDALSRIHSQLEQIEKTGDTAGGETRQESLAIPDFGAQAPELMETRDLIDELDHDLVRLLARRAQLAKRAGSIKASHGKSIRDAARERALLERRKEWAGELNLEPNGIADIFSAIMRFSRALQGK